MEHLNVTFLLTNATKKGRWVGYTFPQKPHSFNRFSILEENCGADIINVTFKCDRFVDRCFKTCRWVSYTFLEKPSLLNHFWIWGNFFLFENQRFWENQYLKVLMASKCDENKNWLSKTQKKSKCKFGKSFCQNASKKKLSAETDFSLFFSHFHCLWKEGFDYR